MSRLSGLILGIGLIAVLPAADAFAAGTAADKEKPGVVRQQLLAHGKPKTERQKCEALNRCRYHYTVCFNKLEASHKLDQKDEKCVKPYQKCINANFSGSEFLFTRWFNPNYIDCSKYPG